MNLIKFLLVSFLITLFNPSFGTIPDEWGGQSKQIFWYNWSAQLNLGLTSYFGDLSQYDTDVTGKLTKESRPAISLRLGKYVNSKFVCFFGGNFHNQVFNRISLSLDMSIRQAQNDIIDKLIKKTII